MKRLAVQGLLRVCSTLDRVPYFDRDDRRWYFAGQYGCRLGFSRLAAAMDERWGTNVWEAASLRRGFEQGA